MRVKGRYSRQRCKVKGLTLFLDVFSDVAASGGISCVKSGAYMQGRLMSVSDNVECLPLCCAGADSETIHGGRSAGNEAPHEESK